MNISNYKKAYNDWQEKYDSHIKNKKKAMETGGAFICVEPPKKPKLEDFIIDNDLNLDSSLVSNYRNAHADWQTKYNSHINSYRNAQETGGAFLCVEPPKKPKLEDFIN